MNIRANCPPIASPLGRNYQSLYSFTRHVAISPDGKKIVTFNPEKSEFEIYNDENLTQHSVKFGYDIGKNENSNYTIGWSLAISNCIDGCDRLIALSRFDSRDIWYENSTKSSQVDEEVGTTRIAPRTWIISESNKTEIISSFQNVGGVVRFLESDMEISGQALIVAVNASGIYKTSIKSKAQTVDDPFLTPSSIFPNETNSIEQFFLPKQFSVSLLSSERWESGLILLQTSIIKNHFVVSGYKDHCHAVEMYSLITGELEMVFQRREPSYLPAVPRGKPIFAISQNELMFAFCRGTNAVTIYMMENGLEVATKELDGQYFNRIISIDFIENDNKLLIILENESGFEKRENHYVFVVWDLFSTSRKAVRQASYSETQDYPLDADSAHRLINSRGKILAVTNWGGIFSLLEHPGIAAILNDIPSSQLVSINLPTHEDAHPVFLLNGERIKETSTVEQKAIINDIEPWHPNKQYNRLFAYLDKSKQTQLIIGPNTVQVWKIRKNKYGTPQRTLEFIWAKENIGSSRMHISQLQIGHCEFVLTLSIPSSERSGISESCTIHWPSNENTLRSACQSLHFLVNKKECIIGNKNANRCEYLIDHTQQLIRRFIKMHSLFRLTDIRYNITKDLIQARQESLIQRILSENINGKNSCIHIPRLYEWLKSPQETRGDSTDPKLKQDTSTLTDLQCAIESANSAAIVELLLEYYTDNAGDFNNPGWMFTVTSAIPYLYKHNLGDLVLKIFKKPCFGTTEAYMPPLHISEEDQKAGNNTESVHVINVRPGLVRKSEPKIMNCLTRAFCGIFGRTQEEVVFDNPAENDRIFSDRKVYMVPLPDFTVLPESTVHPYCSPDYNNDKRRLPLQLLRIFFWPRLRVISDEKKYSSFLHVIDHEKDPDFYSVPSMNAVTDFKWTDARKYFARQVTIYILFAISFIIRSISYIVDAPIQEIYNRLPHTNILSSMALVFMIYFGFYLLATEAVQIKRMGLVKHINLYNIFDLVSVLAPLTVVAIKEGLINVAAEPFQISLAFTVLIMWMQLLLLMRYFKYVGHYIYIIIHILNSIWPFFAFMLIVVIGFGHAMFVLLHKADPSSFRIDSYSIVDPNNVTNNLFPDYQIQHQVNQNSRLDNYYSFFFSSVEAVFFWTNGRWDQINQWDNYALDVMTILGSLVLVLIFQNMLIAFMNGAFDSANEHGRNAVQNFRADLIFEYETLEKPLCHKLRNPRYIYYIPNPSLVNSWLSDIAKEKKTNNRCHFDEEDNYFDSEFDNKSPNSEPKYDTYIEFFDEEDKSSKSSLPSLSITGPREIIRSSSPYLNIYNGDVNTLAGSVAEATDLKYDGCLDGEKSSHERIIHNMEDGIVQRLNAIEYGFAERLSNLENLLLSLKKA